MTWQRARTEDQKEQRIQELTDAAARLYTSNKLSEITIAMIAREAEWTRSNIYKYFATKEEVYLELLRSDVAAWAADVETMCTAWSGSIPEFARAWAKLPRRHERMVGLMSILLPVIEPKCSVERLTAFKRSLLALTTTVAAAVAGAVPFRDAQAAGDFIQASSSLLMGTAPLWNPTEKQLEAMHAAEYPSDQAEFMRVYIGAVEALLVAATNPASEKGTN